MSTILAQSIKLIGSMVDITPLDLDRSAGVAKEWLTPFTAQQEKGDWDWDGAWYDEPDSE